MAYLDEHPPRRSQGRARRAAPSGGVVIHTAEASADVIPPDMTAENVATYIVNRLTAGSYHTVVDSDSIIELWDFIPMEAYHDGTGTNRISTGLSFATHAASWGDNPRWDDAALDQAAIWLAGTYIPAMKQRGIVVRLERTSADKFRAGDPAFVAHGDLDPGRRTDPGTKFPWPRLFTKTQRLLTPRPDHPNGDDEMPAFFAKHRTKDAIYAIWSDGSVRWVGPAEYAYYRRRKPNATLIQTHSTPEAKGWKKASPS